MCLGEVYVLRELTPAYTKPPVYYFDSCFDLVLVLVLVPSFVSANLLNSACLTTTLLHVLDLFYLFP